MTKLSSEELGYAGEDLFQQLSSSSRLVANPSSRDKKGWDFFVQAGPQEAFNESTLDQRREWSCHVQLKSTAEKKGSSVSVKLSTFEPFAKLPGPSFLIVFRLKPDGQPEQGYIIHIIGENLKRVLKRLRTEEARGNRDLSSIRMSFDYRSKAKKFDLTAEGLKTALEAEAGSDPSSYALEKQRQLNELGYEDSHLEGHFLVPKTRASKLSQIWYGVEPIKVSDLTIFDARFGIPVPYRGNLFDGLDELRITPPTIGKWTVALQGSLFGNPAAIFEADVQIAPPEIGGPWAVLRHQDFTISIKEDWIEFETIRVFGETQRSLGSWCTLLRGLSILESGRGKLSITTADGVNMQFPVPDGINGPGREDLPRLRDFLEGWKKILDQAGVVSSETFTIASVKQNRQAQMAVGLLLDPEPAGHLEVDMSGLDTGDTLTAVYFNDCVLADAEISYCVLVTLERSEDGSSKFRSQRFEPVDVRPRVANLKDYGRGQAETCGIQIVLDPEFIQQA